MSRIWYRLLSLSCIALLPFVLTSCPYLEFTVSITASPESGEAPLTVDFFVSTFAERSPETIAWDFGDGTPRVEGPWIDFWHLDHEYATPGSYVAVCSVTEERVLGDLIAHDQVHIVVTEPEEEAFEVVIAAERDTSGCPSYLIVEFSSTVSGGSAPYTYNWDFGDGGDPGIESDPTHLYEAGPFTVVLTVTDAENRTAISNELVVEFCEYSLVEGEISGPVDRLVQFSAAGST